MNLTRTSGIILPKTHPKYIDVIRDLNRSVETFTGSIVNIKFYEELDDFILIPRFYPLDEEIVDGSDVGDDIEIEHTIEPRTPRQKQSMDFFRDNERGVLRLEPGSGKTVLAIWAIATFKKKTIIFAHKDKLLDQWVTEIKKFTNLTDDDIYRLKGDNFKEALEKGKIILSTPQIIGNVLKNKNKDAMEALFNSGIGVMFIDECHVGVGPEQFSKSSLFINSRRTYGLSATPKRMDGNTDIIHMHLGDVTYFPPEEKEIFKPKIYMLYFPFQVYNNHRSYINWGGKFNLSRYYQQLYKSKRYNSLLSRWIRRAHDQGRTVLVLGVNIKSLLELAISCELPKEDVGFFTPSNKRKTLKKSIEKITDTFDLEDSFRTKKVVFSTYGACRDGNNREELDFLVMAAPTSNVEQAIGRVMRMKEGKKRPIVLDVVDTEGPLMKTRIDANTTKKLPWFLRSAYKREQFYKEQEWDVEKCKPNLKD
jgi:superfamily II DNA or RNA helicase